MKAVQTDKAPAAIGPYSQAIVAGNLVYTSGQIPLSPDDGTVVGEDIRTQTEAVIKNLQAVLEAAGSSLQQVIKTTCYLSDLSDFAAFNEVFHEQARPFLRGSLQIAPGGPGRNRGHCRDRRLAMPAGKPVVGSPSFLIFDVWQFTMFHP